MRKSLIEVSFVLCLGLAVVAVRVKIERKDITYIGKEYNDRFDPLEFEYDGIQVERVAVDKRGYVYAVGSNRLSVLQVGKNRRLRLVHTEEFPERFEFQSVQTCNGIVTVAVRYDEEDEDETGALLVFRTYSKHMPGHMRLIHTVEVPNGPEHHQIMRDCKRVIIALETSSRIGIITFGDSKLDEPTLNLLGFGEFEGMRNALLDDWLLLGPAEDAFEDLFYPEWVCLNKKETTAFVNLQENNGVVKVDLTPGSERVTDIISYGILDWSENGPTIGGDFTGEDDGAMLRNFPIFATYNPEQISCITIKNQDCIVLAGEGLTKDSIFFESQITTTELDSSIDYLADRGLVGGLHVLGIDDDRVDPDDNDALDILVSTGSRGFDIRCGDDLAIKASTGSDLEFLTKDTVVYNVDLHSGDETLLLRYDASSEDRGPEPEAVLTKLICGGRHLLMIGISEAPGYLWAFTLDTWNMKAGFKFQDKMHGYERIDSVLTDEELYEERQIYLRDAEGIAFLKGKHGTGRRDRGIVSIVVGSKITSSVETYDLKFQCRPRRPRRPSRRRNKHW